jgi:hypothetical protein
MKKLGLFKSFVIESENSIKLNEGDQQASIKKNCIERLSQFFRVSPNRLMKFKFDGTDDVRQYTDALDATSYEGAEAYYKVAIKLAKEDLGISEKVNENVYPDKNGQLSSYDKKYFTEVGRRTVYLGKDIASIFLFGYSVHDWKGVNEYVAEVTCTSYSTSVKNLGNSSGSIIYSETFGTEKDAKLAIENMFKSYKTK